MDILSGPRPIARGHVQSNGGGGSRRHRVDRLTHGTPSGCLSVSQFASHVEYDCQVSVGSDSVLVFVVVRLGFNLRLTTPCHC